MNTPYWQRLLFMTMGAGALALIAASIKYDKDVFLYLGLLAATPALPLKQAWDYLGHASHELLEIFSAGVKARAEAKKQEIVSVTN